MRNLPTHRHLCEVTGMGTLTDSRRNPDELTTNVCGVSVVMAATATGGVNDFFT